MNDYLRIAARTTAITILAVVPASAQTQWNLREGERLVYVVGSEGRMTIDVAGKAITSGVKEISEVQWTVQGVENGVYLVEETLTRVREKSIGSDVVDYDSERPADANKPTGVTNLRGTDVGKSVELSLGRSGSVSISQSAERADGKADQPWNVPWMAMFFPMFPKSEMQRGVEWTQVVAFGDETSPVSYVYHGTEKRNGKWVDKISFKPPPEFKEAAVKKQSQRAPDWDLKDLSATGVVFFDTEAGRVTEGTYTQTHRLVNKKGATDVFDCALEQIITLKLKEE